MAVLNLGAFSLNPKYLGDAAKPNLFGANFLFNRDGSALTGIDANYKTFIKEAQVTTLRYPGGTLTEARLDLANPDSKSANFMDPSATESMTVPLTTFLQLCKNEGASATIVLPTYRFLNKTPDGSGHRQIDKSEEQNLRAYLKFAIEKANELGVKLAAFEIGNEWYVDNSDTFGFRMSPIEYGRIANYMSAIVQQEIDKLKLVGITANTPEPAIVIQVGPGGEKELYTPSGFRAGDSYTGPTVSATQLIAQQFTDIYARKAVDGILMHRYMTVSDAKAGEWVYSPFKTWSAVTGAMGGFKAVEQYVTEWNVSARNQNERGLAQFDSMFELMREMLLAGVDHANVWGVQQNNKTRLIANTGADGANYGGLTFGGLAFDIASAQLRGLKVLSSDDALSGISINAFGNQSRTVTVLTNRSDTGVIHSVDLAKVMKSGHHATIYRIQEGIYGKPTVQVDTIGISKKPLDYRLTFGGQESIVIVVSAGSSGATVEGYDQNDRLSGSAFGDVISGGDGNDSCHGLNGNDVLYGEAGQDTLLGDEGNDTLYGGAGSDFLNGGAGSDTLFWSPGGDILNGGSGEDTLSFGALNQPVLLDLAAPGSLTALLDGAILMGIEGFSGGSSDDTLLGSSSADFLLGGSGDDLLSGRDGNDRLFGEAGGDTVLGHGGNDSLYGGGGDDLLDGGIDGDLLDGGDGNDVLIGGSGTDTLVGAAGNDTIDAGLGDDRVMAGEGDDSVVGNGGHDSIFGDAGADRILGGDGQDSIYGASGRDTLWGDAGNDLLDGGGDGDRIFGGDGRDRIAGADGDDFLFGGADADTLEGGNGNDILYGEDGADRIMGGDGVDNAFGGLGDDIIFGGSGGDLLRGDDGSDALYGDSGNDHIIGGLGNDTLYGGDGDDYLVDGLGTNALFGGKGQDTFVFSDTVGRSRVMDFKDNVDTLLFRGDLLAAGVSVRQFVDMYARQLKNQIIFDFGDKGSLAITGLSGVHQLYDDVILLS